MSDTAPQGLGELTLYGYWRSSSAWRVRLALHLKGLPFENVPVHLVKDGGQQYSAEHLARNPMGQVPVLTGTLGGEAFTLSQSVAILEFLEQVGGGQALLPEHPVTRARARQLAEMVNSGIQPVQNLTVLLRVSDTLGGDRVEWARWAIGRGLQALEQAVAHTAGEYLVGDTVSFADLCLVPQMYNARRFGVDLTTMPTLTRVDAALSALPAFEAAHPDAQPDAQPKA
ncbi:MAG: maleylacetoacetate isomerase [Bradymonadia bacterium]